MKCKKLILHIGVHKTGTTAIQTFIYENRQALNKQGFYMPAFLFCEEHKPAELRYSILKQDENKTRAYLKEIVEHAKSESCETVIISDEDFCEVSKDDLSHVKIFNEFFEQVEVLMYCRRPDRQSESAYAFCVMWKTSKYSGSPERWFMDHAGKEYYDYASFYQTAIPDCKIRPMSYDFNAHKLIGSFIDVCGMEKIDYLLPKKEASNVSANKFMIEVMNEINKYQLSDKMFLEIKDYVLHHADLQKGPKAIFFSNEQRKENQNLLANKMKKFVDEFYGGKAIFDELVPIRVPNGLEREVKTKIVNEIVEKYGLEGEKQVGAIVRFKKTLKPHQSIAAADIYREIALVCADLDLNHSAYRFMNLAQINRPEGPTIRKKLADYKEKQGVEVEEDEGSIRNRYMNALFVEQSFTSENKANEILVAFQRKLRISKAVEDFELLRELASFCERYNEREAAYWFLTMAKSRKPNDKIIGDQYTRLMKTFGDDENQKRPIVYLHVGANKTASTSIQCSLVSNRERLKKYGDGYLFPKAWGANKSRSFKYLCFDNKSELKGRFKKIFGEKSVEEYNREILDTMITELKDFNGQNYIFSGEDLHHLIRRNMARTRELLELLVPNCEIRVIFVIRNYRSFMNSNTQQTAIGGKSEKKVLLYMYRKGEFFRKAIRHLRLVYGAENLKLFTFEDSLQHKLGPVGFFLEQIGVEEEDIGDFKIERKNESMSNRATKMVFWINEKTAKLDLVGYRDEKALRKFNKRFRSISGSDRYTLDKKILRLFYPQMKKEGTWLKHEFGIDYMDYKKKEADVPVVFEDVFMREMMDLYETIGPAKKHLVYRVFVDRSRSWRMDRKSRSTFASLVKWCENTYPEITDKNFLKTLDRRGV
ncbi:hypothetical protein SANA_28520 [Gottschalkiaceae bacterium SANA]|nr:hypothetical protein SANA_28520 [Gottschalkiaceae bacterium SANA]